MAVNKRSDSQIQQYVLGELKWDTRVKETDVGVEVDGGIVTLTGTVSTWAERKAAQEAAHRVDGVLDVANDIRVKLPGTAGRTDTELAAAVRHALEWDALVPDKRIRSTVSDGQVTLEGDVDFWTQREDAERAVDNLAGVRIVYNKITINRVSPPVPDIRAAIAEALARHARREARDIDIDARDGNVTIKGVVHSLKERDAVIGAARGTRGVCSVESDLRVEPYT